MRRTWTCIAFLLLVAASLNAQNYYYYRGVDSTYSVQLRGATTDPNTVGQTINMSWDSDLGVWKGQVTRTGLYYRYEDPNGGATYSLDSKGTLVRIGSDLGPTAYFARIADADGDGAIDLSTAEDSTLSLAKLTTAAYNFIGAGGTVTNNPDDVTLENKAGSTIGIKEEIFLHSESYSTVETALAEVGANNRTFLVSSNITLSQNDTLPSNLTTEFQNGGKITVGAGDTLWVQGPIEADPYQQIFAGAGKVVILRSSVPRVSVFWFGATTDISNAFDKAIRSAGGKATLYIPAGTYTGSVLNSQGAVLEVASTGAVGDYSDPLIDSVRIVGDGYEKTKIRLADGQTGGLLNVNRWYGDTTAFSSVFVLEDVGFDGNRDNTSTVGSGLRAVVGIRNVRTLEIRNVEILNSERAALDARNVYNATIEKVRVPDHNFETGGKNGIVLRGLAGTFSDVVAFSDSNRFAIVTQCFLRTLEGGGSGQGIDVGTRGFQNITVSENSVLGSWLNSIVAEGGDLAVPDTVDGYIEIINNIVDGDSLTTGIGLLNTDGGASKPSIRHNLIAGNLIRNVGTGIFVEEGWVNIVGNQIAQYWTFGIRCGNSAYTSNQYSVVGNQLWAHRNFGLPSAGKGISFERAHYYLAVGNQIAFPDSVGADKNQGGIWITTDSRFGNVLANNIVDAPGAGIYVALSGTDTVRYTQISNNTIWNPNRSGSVNAARRNGITVDAANKLTLSHNVVADTTATIVYGLRLGGGCVDCVEEFNDFSLTDAPKSDAGGHIRYLRRGNRYYSGAYTSSGTDTLKMPTVLTVNTNAARENARILLSRGKEVGTGSDGALFVSAINDGTSFTVSSTSATDSVIVQWEISQ